MEISCDYLCNSFYLITLLQMIITKKKERKKERKKDYLQCMNYHFLFIT